jgi:hypothetical protein
MAKKQPTTETQEQYRQRIVDLVCEATKETDKGMKRICDAFRKDDSLFPSRRTIRDWISEDANLAAQYARAKEMQADHIFEQIIDIADDDSEDAIFVEGDEESGKSAKMVKNKEFMERSKLRVDTRKWVVAKLLPKKYGDRITQEIEISDSLASAIKKARQRANLPE